MSFQSGNSGWNNNVKPTYFAGRYSGGSGYKYERVEKEKKKKERTDVTEFSSITNSDIEDIQDKNILELLKDLIVSIFRNILLLFGIKQEQEKENQETDK